MTKGYQEIVGLCGFIGAGKDSIADYLVAEHGFKKESFASVLKDVCSVLFGWDRELLEGTTKASRAWREAPDTFWSEKLGIENFSPRRAFQLIGTDVLRRYFHNDIWILAVERKLATLTSRRIVFSDCRFPNEIALIRKLGGVIIQVYRQPYPQWFVDQQHEQAHESETKWLAHVTSGDPRIDNDGSIPELYSQVDNILKLKDSLAFYSGSK